eukprot:366320-Chlamydomonas_euryale.AAC.3
MLGPICALCARTDLRALCSDSSARFMLRPICVLCAQTVLRALCSDRFALFVLRQVCPLCARTVLRALCSDRFAHFVLGLLCMLCASAILNGLCTDLSFSGPDDQSLPRGAAACRIDADMHAKLGILSPYRGAHTSIFCACGRTDAA